MVIGLGLTAGAQTTPLAQGHYRLIAMPVAAGQGAAGQSDTDAAAKDDLFAGTEIFEKGASGVTEITMDPKTLDMVGGKDEHRAHNMVLNVVRTYSYDKPGMYNMADVDRFREKLNTGDWHCSVHVRELKTGESTDVCAKHRTDGLKETAIITVTPKELTFIHTIRREGGPGMSELGALPRVPGLGSLSMLPGLDSMPMVAMMDPELFAEMQSSMNLSPFFWSSGYPMVFDTAKLKAQTDEAMKQFNLLRRPEMQKKIQEQMKELQKLYPQEQKNMDDLMNKLRDFKAAPPATDSLPGPLKQPE
jgi:hypothetical protein